MFSNRLSRRRAILLQRKATNSQASGKRKDKRSPHIGVLASSVAAGAMMLAVPQAAHAQVLPGDPQCVIDGTTVTCTGNLAAGVAVTDPNVTLNVNNVCLLYTSPSPRDKRQSRMPSSA